MRHTCIRILILSAVVAALAACAGVVNKASQRLADSLTAGVLDQDDVAPELLQVQSRTDADHACAQHKNIGLRFRHLILQLIGARCAKPPG